MAKGKYQRWLEPDGLILSDPGLFGACLDRLPEVRRRKALSVRHEESRRLSLGAGLLLAFSCKEKPVEPEEEATKVELPAQTQALFDQGIHFEAEESGPVTLRFTVNKPWVIQVSEGKSVSWIPGRGPAPTAPRKPAAPPSSPAISIWTAT